MARHGWSARCCSRRRRIFSALARAYAGAQETELAMDRGAADVVQQVVALLGAFAEKRRSEDSARARAAVVSGLRRIYLRVRGSDTGETEAPPSRRTWHEGAWQTDDERRAVIVRMIMRWNPHARAKRSGRRGPICGRDRGARWAKRCRRVRRRGALRERTHGGARGAPRRDRLRARARRMMRRGARAHLLTLLTRFTAHQRYARCTNVGRGIPHDPCATKNDDVPRPKSGGEGNSGVKAHSQKRAWRIR